MLITMQTLRDWGACYVENFEGHSDAVDLETMDYDYRTEFLDARKNYNIVKREVGAGVFLHDVLRRTEWKTEDRFFLADSEGAIGGAGLLKAAELAVKRMDKKLARMPLWRMDEVRHEADSARSYLRRGREPDGTECVSYCARQSLWYVANVCFELSHDVAGMVKARLTERNQQLSDLSVISYGEHMELERRENAKGG